MPNTPMVETSWLDAGAEIADHRCETVGMGEYPVQQHDDVGDDEDHEDRRQNGNRFLDPPDIEDDQDDRQDAGHRNLVMVDT